MSVLQLKNQTPNTVIPVGTLIVIDATEARAYDSKTDSLDDDVIGTAFPTMNTPNRSFFIGQGPDYYNLDYNSWLEDMTMELDGEGNPVENPNWASFNPFYDTGNYTTIIISGMVPVLSSYGSVPSRWKLIQSGTTYNWYCVR
jgi:hypothetical protein